MAWIVLFTAGLAVALVFPMVSVALLHTIGIVCGVLLALFVFAGLLVVGMSGRRFDPDNLPSYWPPHVKREYRRQANGSVKR